MNSHVYRIYCIIKIKTSELERIKSKLIEEVDFIETEAKTLESYESELDALIKEKLEQMEILRQIQDDIQTMENTIKQTIEEKKRSVQNAIQLHVDYEPLKHQINDLRESVGLDKLNDNLDISILENYLDKFNPFNQKSDKILPKNESTPSTSQREGFKISQKYPDREDNVKNTQPIQTSIPMPIFNPFTNFNQNLPGRMRQDFQQIQMNQSNQQKVSRPKSPSKVPQMTGQITSEEFNKHFNQFIMNQNKPSQPVPPQPPVTNSIPPPSYRQQPPPMKSCLSCNQQIHRNAPICPLCKAKSRSRNPKKPKKKNEQFSGSISP
ncbi:unnamed protein product [Brachionus calyciflorus]|uniref:C4H2-type domain-containing protein n=1 Tax=Brachionus calyciflorus TaxID=104777 RepID=A0A814H7C6_9BILA|nr:unnamed protein product [Brachionus calyciflorus]